MDDGGFDIFDTGNGGIDWGGLSQDEIDSIINGNVDFMNSLDPNGYGMNDRGLGTSDPNSPGGTLTPAQIAALGSGALGAGTSGGSNPLAGILRSLGLTSGKDGSTDWGSILGMLGILGGAYTANQSTKSGTDAMVNAANSANDQVKSILGGAGAGYNPYIQAGQSALTTMQNQPPSNLAGNFKPLGSGLSLGALARGK